MIPRSYIIIGCGHFGGRAVEKLLRKDPHSRIIAVDKNEEQIKKISHLRIETVICDGLLYLNKFFSEGRLANYIVPAVPFHLAFEFILSHKLW
jgi:saccharopine dehydrogenase-like NADP-dependent oxidoreductase